MRVFILNIFMYGQLAARMVQHFHRFYNIVLEKSPLYVIIYPKYAILGEAGRIGLERIYKND